MNIFKRMFGNSASEEEKQEVLKDVQRHIEKHSVGAPSHTTRRILQGAEIFQRCIRYLEQRAPYYPQYEFFRQSEFLPKILGPREEVEDYSTETFYITTKVRHLHEGTWYARHHVQTYRLTETLLENSKDKSYAINETKLKLVQQLTHAVYLDLKFGQINPDFQRPGGGELDPIDDLQVSEEERLDLK